ncbi:MAG TPA: DMT family transporter [Frankiaceae bacterium]|nr:DMT family transporter [Frankiaceae bacterium]
MSLLVAVPCGVASAIAYGVSTAVEHSAAHESVDETAPGSGLLSLVKNPRWLMGIGGDTLGLVLQVIALSTGPVVLIQPLLVLALPISLPVARWLGGPRPGRSQFLSCLWIILGLGAFFAIVGNPGDADALDTRAAIICVLIAAVVGVAALALVRGRSGTVKAAVYGTVSGAWFGVVAVLLDAAAATWQQHGIAAFGRAEGLVPLVSFLVLGAASLALTQVSYAVGALNASFPGNLTADPVVAVLLGVALLNERIPESVLAVIAYLLCLAAVLFGVLRLALQPAAEPVASSVVVA